MMIISDYSSLAGIKRILNPDKDIILQLKQFLFNIMIYFFTSQRKTKCFTFMKHRIFSDLKRRFKMNGYELKLKTFLQYLKNEDKRNAVKLYTESLNEGAVNLGIIYRDFIINPMKSWNCDFEDDELCIWKEHVASSILHTLVEITYPFILKDAFKNSNGKKVIITCPTQELHDLGIRIVADMFELSGYHVIYAGNNTPLETMLKAIEYESPHIVAISVTTKYNMVFCMKMVDAISGKYPDQKIVLGGQGVTGSGNILEKYKNVKLITDEILPEYMEVIGIKGGVQHETGI